MKNKEVLSNAEMFEFFYMNFQSILDSKNMDISALSNLAIEKKTHHQNHFLTRLSRYADNFKNGNLKLDTYLSGWDIDYINDVINQYGGVLCGFFHFGAHRHCLVDLAAQNISTVAPIAGQSYYDLKNVLTKASKEKSQRVQLLEVEGEQVSRELLKGLKAGRVGGIYVDGNMGPEDNINKDSCTQVKFFNHHLYVKAGIARLSSMLKLPILPVFCSNTGHKNKVDFGTLITPNSTRDKEDRAKGIEATMQALYTELETKVKESPSDWEYALCLHRWINTPKKKNILLEDMPKFNTLKLQSHNVSAIEKDSKYLWINTQLGKGFKVPDSLVPIFKELYNQKSLSKHDFNLVISKYKFSLDVLIKELLTNDLITLN